MPPKLTPEQIAFIHERGQDVPPPLGLPPREYAILALRFPKDNQRPTPYRTIAEQHGYTIERVKGLEGQAISRLYSRREWPT